MDDNAISKKSGMDRAYDFLAKGGADFNEEQGRNIDLKRLRRKVDWRIVPLMFACYTLQFLDRVALNVRVLL